jgi:hypothetical protein
VFLCFWECSIEDARCQVSQQALTSNDQCLLRIWVFLNHNNHWYLHTNSCLDHKHHPKLNNQACDRMGVTYLQPAGGWISKPTIPSIVGTEVEGIDNICSSHNTSSVHWHHYCDCHKTNHITSSLNLVGNTWWPELRCHTFLAFCHFLTHENHIIHTVYILWKN